MQGSWNGPRPALFVEVGQRFGSLVVTSTDARIGVKPTKPKGWRGAVCRCDCGAETTVTISGLISGKNKSCGKSCDYSPAKIAARSPAARARAAALGRKLGSFGAAIHGRTPEGEARRLAAVGRHGFASRENRHPLYQTWTGILARCDNPAAPNYARYGGRGISVYPPWRDLTTFIKDIEASIGPRPEGAYPSGRPLYSIDRIDNDSGYRPGNVRWATGVQQQANTGRPGAVQCSEDDCERVAKSRGKCHMHYVRARKASRPKPARVPRVRPE